MSTLPDHPKEGSERTETPSISSHLNLLAHRSRLVDEKINIERQALAFVYLARTPCIGIEPQPGVTDGATTMRELVAAASPPAPAPGRLPDPLHCRSAGSPVPAEHDTRQTVTIAHHLVEVTAETLPPGRGIPSIYC